MQVDRLSRLFARYSLEKKERKKKKKKKKVSFEARTRPKHVIANQDKERRSHAKQEAVYVWIAERFVYEPMQLHTVTLVVSGLGERNV